MKSFSSRFIVITVLILFESFGAVYSQIPCKDCTDWEKSIEKIQEDVKKYKEDKDLSSALIDYAKLSDDNVHKKHLLCLQHHATKLPNENLDDFTEKGGFFFLSLSKSSDTAIRILLNKADPNKLENIFTKNVYSKAIFFSAKFEHNNVLDALCEKIAPNQDNLFGIVDATQRDGQFTVAKVIKAIFKNINPNKIFDLIKKQDSFDQKTVLHNAAEKGHSDIIRTLLEKIEPDKIFELFKIKAEYDETVLHRAASLVKYYDEEGAVETVVALLEKVKPNHRTELLQMKNDQNNTVFELISSKNFDSDTLKVLKIYESVGMPGLTWALGSLQLKLILLKTRLLRLQKALSDLRNKLDDPEESF